MFVKEPKEAVEFFKITYKVNLGKGHQMEDDDVDK